MGSQKNLIFREGVHKKPIYMGELPRGGGGPGQFADLKGGLAKKRGLFFGEGLIPQYTLW